ncbi:hypothetical protein N7494_000287 [Penicillium frequentans]|uniref:Uncharacterized protein n=1 Tax=Penicillium frequentans TaxID=3151616 RepID=A0AAD6D5M6_9EURO|nr:hypothetical protein N7494_000287 [Penicillium glabrum]
MRHVMVDDDKDRFSALHGVFGTLWMRKSGSSRGINPSKAYFTQHKSAETGMLSDNALTIGDIFWLSVGCLPVVNGNIYCLENVDEVVANEKMRFRWPAIREEAVNQHSVQTAGQTGHFDINSDESSEFSENSEPDTPDDRLYGQAAPRILRRRRVRRGPVVYTYDSMTAHEGQSQTGPRTFRFSASNGRVEFLSEVANSLEATDTRGVVYSLEEVDFTNDAQKELDESIKSTYHPIDGAWVRLGKEMNRSQRTMDPIRTFLERESAHTIAKALLDIHMSADGYLMPCDRSSLCRATLCNAAQYLPHLMGRMANNIDNLLVPAKDQENTVIIFDNFLNMCLDFKPDRPFFQTLSELDSVLTTLTSPDLKSNTAIGIIMLTSAEFRDIIAQSARLIPQSKDKVVTLKLGKLSTLDIPSSMGVVQKFPIDQSVLFPDQKVRTEVVHHLLFAALKACLRSVFLETSLDSTPLFGAFLKIGETVHMGSDHRL